MADSKDTSKKAPAKKPSSSKSKSAAPKKPKKSPAAVKKERYERLLAARHRMQEARADVLAAELAANRAYAYQGDFRARDAAYAEALAELNAARERASKATTEFQIMKMKGGKK